MPTRSSRPAPVLADIHERASGVPRLLAQLGAAVEVASLPAGDYAIGPAILIERKSMPDLHETIQRGRFWRQIDKIRRASQKPFLLVEGADLDDGPISPKAIRGICVAAIAGGVRFIRTKDRGDSAMWLYAIAARAGRTARVDRPAHAQRPAHSAVEEAAEAVLAAVPGISTVTARALLSHFGTVAGVATASPEALLNVRGVGPDRARALDAALNFPPRRSHSTDRQPWRSAQRRLNLDGGRRAPS